MSAAHILSNLERTKRTGHNKWTACCPAHEDRAPSLSIRELDDGRVLLHCFGGCSTEAVIGAMGLRWEDLMEPLPPGAHQRPKVRRPWSIGDAYSVIEKETSIIAIVICDLAKGGALPEAIKDRILKATGRLNHVVEVLRA